MMRGLLHDCFKADELQFIDVTNFGVEWTDYKNKFKTTFDKVSLKLAVSFLLDNGVIILAICHFGKSLESQWVLHPAPFTFHDKLIFILLWEKMAFKHQKRDLQKACLFGNLFCFLDDL